LTIARTANWAGNVTFSGPIRRPTSVPELQDLVAGADAVRAVGSRHSFNSIADSTGLLVSVEALDVPIEVDAGAATVTVGGGATYAEVCRALDGSGLAVPNLGSLPHISVAGACATGTHGSGDGNGVLATAVSGLEMVTADGSLVSLSRDADGGRFAGSVVALGTLGVVVSVTLDLVPAFEMRQWVYDGLSWSALTSHLDEIFASGYSVSVFTGWLPDSAGQLWLKRRADDDRADAPELFGARVADAPRHPIAGMPVENCTEQLGRPGWSHDRLPHFRAEFTPSAGDELQSEFLLPRRHAVAAIETLRGLSAQIAPVLHVGELRTVARDDLWLSPAYDEDVIGIHFTWIDDAAAVSPVLAAVDEALRPYGARPHWGKLFVTPSDVVRSLYPRLADFTALAREFDPDGVFGNEFVDRYLT
jgi:alditol oxidase